MAIRIKIPRGVDWWRLVISLLQLIRPTKSDEHLNVDWQVAICTCFRSIREANA